MSGIKSWDVYAIPRQRRREIKALARRFAAGVLRAENSPEWAGKNGITPEEEIAFHAELRAIADRIE